MRFFLFGLLVVSLLVFMLNELTPSEDPRADLIGVIGSFRQFVRDNPVLADLMFSRPFTDFDPGPAERRAGDEVRQFIVGTVRL